VVELNKVAGHPIELALEPGRYQVTLDRQGQLSGAEITLVDGAHVRLDPNALLALSGEATVSRGEGPLRVVPFNLSAWKGLDLNGSGRVTDRFSFAPLVGGSTRVDGFAFAGIGSFIDEDVSGMQLSGILNVQGGTLHGFDFAGVLNRAGRVESGFQFAGVGNLSSEPSSGLALGGVFNHAFGGWSGLQFSGVYNAAGGEGRLCQMAGTANWHDGGQLTGAQLSGVFNYAEALRGAQLSLVNVGGSVKGAQVGLVNVASEATAQVGLVNLGDDVDTAVGMVSVSRDTGFHFEAWAGDLAPANAALQIRGRRLYTIFAAGLDPFRGTALFYSYFGIGLHYARGPWWFEPELGMANGYLTTHWDNSGLIPKLSFHVGYAFDEHLSVFAGVALDLLILPPDSTFPDVGYGLEVSGGSPLTRVHFWPAPYAGVRF
jgi:hypothetical protein